MEGNPKVRVRAQVLEEYRRLANTLGLRLGELVSLVLEEALRNPAFIAQAVLAWSEKRGLQDYEAYPLFRRLRRSLLAATRQGAPREA